ncbi:MAG: hypothetical protein CML37_04130 [Rhodobacteraceae bacterium]|nr:hypothetical protein [Paracoccaceae bacterium]
MGLSNCIYVGDVMHMRLRPKKHKFRYKMFSLFLDIDSLERVNDSLKLFSLNSFGFISLYYKDHAARDNKSLRPWVDSLLKKHGLPKVEKVFLLSFPRILGFGFNPLSIYFCYIGGKLSSIIYEVKNTYGDQIPYVFAAEPSQDGAIRHAKEKEMYVSPFLDMEQIYHFTIHPPGQRLAIRIKETGAEGKVLIATQTGNFQPLSDRNLLMALFSYPLMGIKVTLAIHWHALRLFLKGMRYHSYAGWVRETNKIDK